MTPNIEPRLEETSFTLPHRIQKPQKTTAPDPTKLAQGPPQPSQIIGSPGTLALMVGHPKFGNDPQYRAKAGRDKFHPTARDPKTPENYRTEPHKICAGISPAQSDYV